MTTKPRTPVTDRPADVLEVTKADPAEAPRELTDAELAGIAATGTGTGTIAGAEAMTPTMTPPGTASAIAAAGDTVTTWQADKRVGALWSSSGALNTWAYVNAVGWKRFAPTSDSSVSAMTILTSQAKQVGARVDYRDEADGLIHEVYLW